MSRISGLTVWESRVEGLGSRSVGVAVKEYGIQDRLSGLGYTWMAKDLPARYEGATTTCANPRTLASSSRAFAV
jgi:hypothetical protein